LLQSSFSWTLQSENVGNTQKNCSRLYLSHFCPRYEKIKSEQYLQVNITRYWSKKRIDRHTSIHTYTYSYIDRCTLPPKKRVSYCYYYAPLVTISEAVVFSFFLRFPDVLWFYVVNSGAVCQGSKQLPC
jgi:hypothetical protein